MFDGGLTIKPSSTFWREGTYFFRPLKSFRAGPQVPVDRGAVGHSPPPPNCGRTGHSKNRFGIFSWSFDSASAQIPFCADLGCVDPIPSWLTALPLPLRQETSFALVEFPTGKNLRLFTELYSYTRLALAS